MEGHGVNLNQSGCASVTYHFCVDSVRREFFPLSLCNFGSDRNKLKAN